MTGIEVDPELRSYGRRRGRKLSPRQARLMAELLPRLTPSLDAPPPATLAALFAAPDAAWASEGATSAAPDAAWASEGATSAAPDAAWASEGATNSPVGHAKARPKDVWLEIGFGGGEHLLWQARQNPDVGLIGAEPFEDGVVKVLAAVEAEGLRNIRLLADDARALLRWLPAASIGRVFILFPDPWPKRRHVKRRLVNQALLGLLARIMRPGAELRIGTDIGDYARTMLMAFQASPDFVWLAGRAADWRERPADWPMTRYEQKAVREGRRSAYLRFARR